jgi:hypothetical protein
MSDPAEAATSSNFAAITEVSALMGETIWQLDPSESSIGSNSAAIGAT